MLLSRGKISKVSLKTRQHGAALLELALILPLLAGFTVGVVNFGVALKEKQVIVEAARYGARRAAATGTPFCDEASESAQYQTCDQILGTNYDSGVEDAIDSGAFYACQSIESAGLDATQWEVNAELDSDGLRPTIAVQVQRAIPGQFFVRSFAGDFFPASRGAFVTQKDCGDLNA